ncbi:MAG: mercury(II) reductase [Anaerolinea sp.]|nr:mercury(II) reductase [Anaerolinea sp.]
MNEIEQLELTVEGMTCDACAHHVSKALQQVAGVIETAVPGWQSGKATVKAAPGVSGEALAAAVQGAGYTAVVNSRQSLAKPTSRNGSYDYDLMVIGGGSAGFAAAIKAAELGYHAAIVEAGTMGGTCVNIGCVPSKTLIRAVETAHQAGTHRFQGIHTAPGQIEWPKVIAQKDELVASLRQGKYADVLAGYPDVDYIEGYATLTGKNRVEINGRTYSPYRILIATGARPWAPPIDGLAEAGYLDSTAVLALQERPSSLIVLGANAVGLEMAQTYARAGAFVTVVELLPRIAPFEDEAISTALTGYLAEEGLRIVTGFATKRVQKENGRYQITGSHQGREITLDAEQLLVATGRRPNTANMGLAESGVKLGPRGEILVDDTLRTDNPFVYAAGDVTGQDMFVYVAAYAGGLAAENALNGLSTPLDTGYIPRITFTDPQIASAGLTEAQAIEKGHAVKVSTLAMSHVPRALAARDTRGLIKLVADADSDRLLGAHILAPEGGELIQTAVLAIRFGITVSQLRQTMFPYLTNGEGIKLALLGFEKDVALLSCCAG